MHRELVKKKTEKTTVDNSKIYITNLLLVLTVVVGPKEIENLFFCAAHASNLHNA
jgi:hypothetical protein